MVTRKSEYSYVLFTSRVNQPLNNDYKEYEMVNEVGVAIVSNVYVNRVVAATSQLPICWESNNLIGGEQGYELMEMSKMSKNSIIYIIIIYIMYYYIR